MFVERLAILVVCVILCGKSLLGVIEEKGMNNQQSKVYKTTPYKDGCTNQVEYDTLDIYGSGSCSQILCCHHKM